ncbi:receptor-type tyrosine-protein phosphatase epsilon-like [Pomacea canaliculata]|uniref:receptor-type tyrosine-protein phosphatase epsilon-like n=1 Tax=Pomacea canaliculata TaxID=400727 RepID=UPI000D72FC75|nr:receptor-type tyrosine-protein phosphatase epsilon-like [Pomacea canaliculata]
MKTVPPGNWGQNCTEVCNIKCQDHRCNPASGVCNNCSPGFKGDLCESPCTKGTYGARCPNKCSVNCGGADADCDPKDGKCSSGCKVGWKGDLCTDKCVSGTYGANCTQVCSKFCRVTSGAAATSCHHVSGRVHQGCLDGYTGVDCYQQIPASAAAMIGGVVAGVALAVIVVAVVVVVVVRRKRRWKKTMSPDSATNYASMNGAFVADGVTVLDEDELSNARISLATGTHVEKEKQVYYNINPDTSSTRFPTTQLDSLLDRWRLDPTSLKGQFERLPKGFTGSTQTALNDANRGKNRYKNICAYDHSRVKLSIIDGDPNSDYINACYISGFNGEPKFIASQGPSRLILQDFLRMLWEKRVHTVVMLTNLIEGGTQKCEQYWSDSGERKYGAVTVTLVSVRRTADYTVRALQLKQDGESHSLTQFHFTAWPDKGAPVSPWPLVDFHMTVKEAADLHKGSPIVVHCSAGIGRTGTYIALDNLLAEAAETGHVDFNTCVWKLRQARVNMVQTVEQYIFLHEAVSVSLAVSGTLLKRSQIPEAVGNLFSQSPDGQSKLEAEFKRLSSCLRQTNLTDYSAGQKEENKAKNRFHNILPQDAHRVELTPAVSGGDDYINAIFIPGYKKRHQYVATQLPLATTVVDFWTLVHEYPVSVVVIFPGDPAEDHETRVDFLPGDGETCQYGPYKLSTRLVATHEGYQEMLVNCTKPKRLNLTLLRGRREVRLLKCLQRTPSVPVLLHLTQAAALGITDEETDESIVLVACRTGAELSGMFVTLAHVQARLADTPVSVPALVGYLRTIRPQFISSPEQYQTLYEAVKMLAEGSSVVTNGDKIYKKRSTARKPQRELQERKKKTDDNSDEEAVWKTRTSGLPGTR